MWSASLRSLQPPDTDYSKLSYFLLQNLPFIKQLHEFAVIFLFLQNIYVVYNRQTNISLVHCYNTISILKFRTQIVFET